MPSQAEIEQLAIWLAETDISTLELRDAGGILRLERRGASIAVVEPHCDSPQTPGYRPLTLVADTPGIFLHAHPLRAAPLVHSGDVVAAGESIGLLRIGEVLLPVRAPVAGRFDGYWAEDGTKVGYGAPLIELQVRETET